LKNKEQIPAAKKKPEKVKLYQDKEKKLRLFERFAHSKFKNKAETGVNDKKFLDHIKEQSDKLGGVVRQAADAVKVLIDYLFGKNGDIGSKIYTIAALLYFISPLDFIPDVIPVLGYLDDIAILGMVAGAIISKVANQEKEMALPDIVRNTLKTAELRKDLRHDQLMGMAGAKNQTPGRMDKDIKKHLIIVIISLSGALVAAVITLLLKFYFKVF
jgi:uncharacterized membrane protein YkvA (DUF1232 family)